MCIMIRKRNQHDRRVIATDKYVGHPLPETIQECESDDNVDEIRTRVSRTISPELRSSTQLSLTQNRNVQLTYTGLNGCQRVTGSATERSSIYSFGDDDFDRESSLSVQKLFDDVDLILFERNSVGAAPSQLRSECAEWISVFPHLRVVGRANIPAQEFGYKFFEYKEESDLTPRNTDDLNSSQELVARGTSIRVNHFPGAERFSYISESDSDFLDRESVEEIFVQEGLVEEVLAIDRRSFGDEGNGCLQREVLNNLFNESWTDVINGLEELLSKHLHHFFSRQSSSYPVPLLLDPFHDGGLYSSTHGGDMFLRRHSMTLITSRQTAPDKISRQFSNVSVVNTKLEEVLKISSKALQVRDRNFSHDLSDCPLTRPSSSGQLPLSGRPYNPRVVNEYIPSSRSRLVAGRGKLNPISSHDQIKVFTMEDEKLLDLSHEVIRGYRISNVNSRQLALVSSSSPPSTMSTLRPPPTRPLPPILSRDTTRSSAGHNNIFRRKPLLRVRSAVPNKAGLQTHDRGERAWATGDNLRPHRVMQPTAVPDHPHVLGVNKRSSTTLGFNSHQNQLAETVGGVLVKGHRKLNVLSNQIPEYDPDADDDSLSDVVRISSNFSFGRRTGQRDQHFSTAIR